MTYQINENFILRTPMLPFKNFNYHFPKNVRAEGQDVFYEMLVNSSPNLYESTKKFPLKNDGRISLSKYYNRMSTRTTPFGLAAVVHRGEFNKKQNLEISNIKKKIILDVEWLKMLILKIEEVDFPNFSVLSNSTFQILDNKILKIWNTLYVEESNFSPNKKKITMNYTRACELIIENTNEYTEIKYLLIILKETYPKTNEKIFMNFVKTLLQNEILISEYRINLKDGNFLKNLIKKIEGKKNLIEFYKKLKILDTEIDKYERIQIGAGIDMYQNIERIMDKIVACDRKLNVISYSDSLPTINIKEKKKLSEFASFLSKWSYSKNYNEYVTKFLEKFGDVPIKYIEMIDNNIGIGKPYYSKDDLTEHHDFFYSRVLETILNSDKLEIDLADMDSSDLKNQINPINGEISFYLTKSGEELKMHLSPLQVTNSKGRSIGRFNELYPNLLKKNFEDGKNFSETLIFFTPSNSRDANVMGTFEPGVKYLEIGNRTIDNNRIELSDVYVKIIEGKLHFFDIKSKKQLIFYAPNMYRQDRYPIELKYLLEIDNNQWGSLTCFLEDLSHMISVMNGDLPRFVYKDIDVFPKSWDLRKTILSKNKLLKFIEFESNLLKKYNSKKIDRFIISGYMDQQLLIDIEDEKHRQILYKNLKNSSQKRVYESNNKFDNLIVSDKSNEYYIGEFIFQVEDKNNIELRQKFSKDMYSMVKKESSLSQKKLITNNLFNDWVSINLYLDKIYHDDFIKNKLYEFVANISNIKNFERFFFIRYIDEHDHLRIRIKSLDSKKKYIFLQIIEEEITKWKQEFPIYNFNMNCYVPEVRRYGGETLISYVEEFFYVDSLVTMELLNIIGTDKSKKNDLFLFSAIDILRQSKYSYSEIANLLLNFRISKKDLISDEYDRVEGLIDGYLNYYLNEQDVDNNFLKIKLSFAGREQKLINYFKKIDELFNNSIHEKNSIINSLLHMSHNRIVGIDRENENRILGYMYKYYYKKSQQEKYKIEGDN